jgi:formiminotetrahydrofolate cyclodeaminase
MSVLSLFTGLRASLEHFRSSCCTEQPWEPAVIADQPIGGFLDALAAVNATPGGGSATALLAAVAAALVSMVCRLSVDRQQVPAGRDEMAAALEGAQGLRRQLMGLMDEDVAAFDAVMRAYALPRSGEAERAARSQAIQAAMRTATLVPLACARACGEVLELARFAAEKGHSNAAGEAGVAALTAHAALRCAALNVRINVGSIRDAGFVQATLAELDQIVRRCGEGEGSNGHS